MGFPVRNWAISSENVLQLCSKRWYLSGLVSVCVCVWGGGGGGGEKVSSADRFKTSFPGSVQMDWERGHIYSGAVLYVADYDIVFSR